MTSAACWDGGHPVIPSRIAPPRACFGAFTVSQPQSAEIEVPQGVEIEVPQSSFRSLVTPEEMQRLRQPDAARVCFDLGLIWLQILASLALYLWHPTWWTFAAAFVLVAGGQHGLMLATHEFSHFSLFPNDRRLNDFLGTWLFGAPSGIPLRIFRHRHFNHHRTYSTDDDTKTVYRHDFRGMGLLREILRSLSGFEFVAHALEARGQDAREAAAGRSGPRPAEALPSLVLVQGTIFLAFWWVSSPWLYFTLWLLPLVTLSDLFQKVRATMEHRPLHEEQGVAPGSGFYGDTPGPFVRTVRASWIERLFVCKLNFGFHVEHHLWPQVSYQHLPSLRPRLEVAGTFEDPRFGRESTYFGTLYKLWRPSPSPEGRPGRTEAMPSKRAAVAGIETQPVPRCPACDSAERRLLLRVVEHEYTTTTSDEFPLVACGGCGAWYLDPKPAAGTLSIIYPPDYYAYVQDSKEQSGEKVESRGIFSKLGSYLFQKRIAPIARHIALGPDKRWLDIGCGNGSVLRSMKETYGVEGTGLDLSPDAAAFCRKRGFEAHAGRFEDYRPAPGEAYDLVHSSHVIEHLESPYEYLRKTFEMLKPGGLSVFITPNTDTWEARAFGRHWGGLHVPRHWTLLDAASARKLGERAGFEHVETRFSTNGTFWTWSFHSLFRGRIPDAWNDAIFPSDYRFVESNAWNIARIGLFTVFDALNLVFTRRSSNMLVILRKPPSPGDASRGLRPGAHGTS